MSKAVVFFADGTEECEALLVVDLQRLCGFPYQNAQRHHEFSIMPVRKAVMSMPAARTILGTSEALVMPGIVLTSRK